MGKICKKSWIAGIFLGVMLFAAGFAFQATTIDAQAASTGFRTVGGQTFYYKKGKKVKGWVTVKGKKYFLNRKTGALYNGWMKSSKGRRRYFDQKTGAMYTGFNKIAGQYYYFNKKTGFTVSGFVKFGTNFYRYFDTRKYTMATGWMTNSKNQKWYFGSDGKMYRGLKKIGSYKYYFDGKTGAAKYGFITSSKGYTRYFRKKYYRMATGWMTSSKGKKRYFAKFNVEGLLRGDYQSRMNGYAVARQNGWMSANDIREVENLDRIPAEAGGDLYLVNGNMLPMQHAGAFASGAEMMEETT